MPPPRRRIPILIVAAFSSRSPRDITDCLTEILRSGARALLTQAILVIVALANKMARIAWAVQAKGGVYRAPAVVG